MTDVNQNVWPDHIAWEVQIGRQNQLRHMSLDDMLTLSGTSLAFRKTPDYVAANRALELRLDKSFDEYSLTHLNDLLPAIADTRGAFVEVGGPTTRYDAPLPSAEVIASKTKRRVHMANLIRADQVDIQADANALPFRNKTLGLVMASCLPMDARVNFFKEAERTLEDGGVLAYQRARDLDFAHVLSLGFTVLAHSRQPREDIGEVFSAGKRMWSFVAQKPTS